MEGFCGCGLGKKCFCGGEPFFQGVLAFSWCLVMVNRGDVVVNCVVNRGAWRTLFRRAKIFLFLKYYLGRVQFWTRGFDEPDGSSAL
jgi:hypothetical protein